MARMDCRGMGCQPALFRNVSCSIQGKSARRRLKSGTAAAPAGPALATPATPERKLRRSGFMRSVYTAVDYEAMWKRLSYLVSHTFPATEHRHKLWGGPPG